MVMCVSIPLDLALPSKKQAHWWCSLCQQQVLASIMHPSLPAFGGAMLVVNPAACGRFMTVMGLKTSKCNHLAAHLPSHLYSFAGSWTSQLWHCWGSDLDNKPTVTFLDRCYIANHFQQMQRQKKKNFPSHKLHYCAWGLNSFTSCRLTSSVRTSTAKSNVLGSWKVQLSMVIIQVHAEDPRSSHSGFLEPTQGDIFADDPPKKQSLHPQLYTDAYIFASHIQL